MPLTISQFSQFLPPTRSGRTVFVASSLLGVGAVLQLGFLGWYLAHGGARTVAAAKTAPAPASAPRFMETMQPNVAPVDLPGPTPAVAAADDPQSPYAVLPRPTPAPERGLPVGASGDALEQARALRQRGDMRAALSRLREALVAEPDNPQAIAELALTYEAMQLADKAAEQWQRIFAMGESVGALYYLADTKLHSVSNAPSSADSNAGSRRPGGPTQTDRTVLKITSINAEEIPDPSTEQKVAIKIVVKGLPGVVINPEKVKIEAYFYDLIDGKDMVQTDAQTDFAWLSPQPINWANDKSEVLEALYVRPKGVALMPGPPAAASSRNGSRRRPGRNDKSKPVPEPAETPAADVAAAPVRKYLGYSVRLYYNGQLQEVQADPVRLLERFQAPLTLPSEDSQATGNPGAPR